MGRLDQTVQHRHWKARFTTYSTLGWRSRNSRNFRPPRNPTSKPHPGRHSRKSNIQAPPEATGSPKIPIAPQAPENNCPGATTAAKTKYVPPLRWDSEESKRTGQITVTIVVSIKKAGWELLWPCVRDSSVDPDLWLIRGPHGPCSRLPVGGTSMGGGGTQSGQGPRPPGRNSRAIRGISKKRDKVGWRG